MCSRCLSLVLLAGPLFAAGPGTLRVCADPNNLPFSNERGEGFENRLAKLVADDMGSKLEFVWWGPRKGLVKNSLDEDRCDVLMDVPASLGSVSATTPYYRSTYVFVSRQDRHLHISSLNDERLAKWRIGIHIVGNDYAPPAWVLSRRGLSANVAGYSLFGAYGEQDPPARLIDAVVAGDVDVAIVWGPLAGYFAQHSKTPLEVTPVSPQNYLTVPFVFEMAMGVQKGNDKLLAALNQTLQRRCADVQAVLHDYGVPLVPGGEGKQSCDASRLSPAALLH